MIKVCEYSTATIENEIYERKNRDTIVGFQGEDGIKSMVNSILVHLMLDPDMYGEMITKRAIKHKWIKSRLGFTEHVLHFIRENCDLTPVQNTLKLTSTYELSRELDERKGIETLNESVEHMNGWVEQNTFYIPFDNTVVTLSLRKAKVWKNYYMSTIYNTPDDKGIHDFFVINLEHEIYRKENANSEYGNNEIEVALMKLAANSHYGVGNYEGM